MTEPVSLTLDSVPESAAAFVTLQTAVATTPAGGAAVFLMALHLFREQPELGAACLAASVDASRLRKGAPALTRRDLSRIDEQLRANPGLPAAYFAGTSPGQGYALPEMPWRVVVTTNPYSGDAGEGKVKLFVACSGADSARPVTLVRQDDGLWKAWEWSSLLMGIRPADGAAQG